MNKAFEKILENIENLKLPFPDECPSYYGNTNKLLDMVKEIVQEVAEEYNNEKTNADSIRTMSDEELAMNMMCPNESGLGEIECDKSDNCNCYKCLLKWLQSEVEEN